LIGSTGRFDNVLKIRPPLVFSREHADILLWKLALVMDEIRRTRDGVPGDKVS